MSSLDALRTSREEPAGAQQVRRLHSDGLPPAAAAQRPTGGLKIAAEAAGGARHCALERRRRPSSPRAHSLEDCGDPLQSAARNAASNHHLFKLVHE